jgi:exo-beta-1,3-glucanase (GH17 family)
MHQLKGVKVKVSLFNSPCSFSRQPVEPASRPALPVIWRKVARLTLFSATFYLRLSILALFLATIVVILPEQPAVSGKSKSQTSIRPSQAHLSSGHLICRANTQNQSLPRSKSYLITSSRSTSKDLPTWGMPPRIIQAYRLYGMNFSPYIDGQDPNFGTIISEAQLRSRMQIIANHTLWVRSFGCTHGLEKVGMVAHSLGLKAAVGAWLGRDPSANSQEIANLISAAQAGQVDLAIVGSEVLLRNDLTESQLIGYMNQVRQQIPAHIPVTTADVYGKLLDHPSVIANCDVVLPNYYPYWEGASVDISIATLDRQHQRVKAAAQGKPIIVSETGWPSAGNAICNAVPSPTNASFYFLNFISWARANNVPYFYFAALDEAWKANHGEGPQGAHWGVWDKNGVLKSGMQAVFDGQTMPNNWTNAGIPGGPGSPSIEFTSVPPYGSLNNNLFGQVLHVDTDDYKVAVYIYVGGWWNKPTFASPLTNIGLTGSWECDITTGGSDQNATQIVAYVVPANFTPPEMRGGQTLPSTLDQNSVARTQITRSSTSLYIQGRVTDSNNQGLSCVTISLTGSQTATTHTSANGSYSFINLHPGGNYTVTPSYLSYRFTPTSLTFSNLGNNPTGNFVASPNAYFLDVPESHPFFTEIGKLAARGITLGCGNGNYCPAANVTREQMAAFIIRALGNFNPPTPASQRFADVPPSNIFYAFIEQMAVRQITLGCGGGNYCPTSLVTREQMAAFLIRALHAPGYFPPAPAQQRFSDVPPWNPFYAHIEEMAVRQITLGCGGNSYCPTQNVTRGQMAAFLVRAFNL